MSAPADLVRRGDPDRFRAALAARAGLREGLFTLFAFNLEVARAPWVTSEPMIAEMRLQWWRDVLTEPAPRAHEVAGPLHALIARHHLPIAVMDRLIAARLHEVWQTPHEGEAGLWDYLDATTGSLFWLSALLAGAEPVDRAPVRAFGQASGLAQYLAALPALAARGLPVLPDPGPDAIARLAEVGLARLDGARPALDRLRAPVAEALMQGWQARALLRKAARNPWLVLGPGLALSPFHQRASLLLKALGGRPWA